MGGVLGTGPSAKRGQLLSRRTWGAAPDTADERMPQNATGSRPTGRLVVLARPSRSRSSATSGPTLYLHGVSLAARSAAHHVAAYHAALGTTGALDRMPGFFSLAGWQSAGSTVTRHSLDGESPALIATV